MIFRERTIFVYVITNRLNKKTYVGQTKNLRDRWNQHRCEARRGNKSPLYRAIRKYGEKNFTVKTVECFFTRKEASYFERALIDFMKSTSHRHGYNVDLGGHTAGKHSKETKRKIGYASRGRKHSKETRRRMSASQKGKKRSEEAKKNISEGIKKQWANPESRTRKCKSLRRAWKQRRKWL